MFIKKGRILFLAGDTMPLLHYFDTDHYSFPPGCITRRIWKRQKNVRFKDKQLLLKMIKSGLIFFDKL